MTRQEIERFERREDAGFVLNLLAMAMFFAGVGTGSFLILAIIKLSGVDFC